MKILMLLLSLGLVACNTEVSMELKMAWSIVNSPKDIYQEVGQLEAELREINELSQSLGRMQFKQAEQLEERIKQEKILIRDIQHLIENASEEELKTLARNTR